MTRPSRHRTADIWPGFVDALGSLIIILMFVLLVFVVGQFFLGQQLSGKKEEVAALNTQVASLTDALKLEQIYHDQMQSSVTALTAELETASQKMQHMESTNEGRTAQTDKLITDIDTLRRLHQSLEEKLAEKDHLLAEGNAQLNYQKRKTAHAESQSILLRQQLTILNAEIEKLTKALGTAELVNKEQEVQISDLGRQLNRALATRIQELQKYRSEFFGQLRQALGNHPDFSVRGDRFVFQSEVLFSSGSAQLEKTGREKLKKLAKTLLKISQSIPQKVDWILRIDGHTDRLPIRTSSFHSNWELSAARAISVVRFLIEQGISPHRLAAAGFGEHRPLTLDTRSESLATNRRIEIKFDQR